MTHQISQRTLWLARFVLLLFFGMPLGNAFAQYPSTPVPPPVRYQFHAYVGYYYKSYPVADRMALCTEWMATQNPKPPSTPIWTNPRLRANIDGATAAGGGNPIFAHCDFTSIYGDPDGRSPGSAYCGDDYASYMNSPFIVDNVLKQCVCPPGHYHIFQMFRFGGKCQWKYLGGKVGKGVLETPADGMAACSSYPGFTGR